MVNDPVVLAQAAIDGYLEQAIPLDDEDATVVRVVPATHQEKRRNPKKGLRTATKNVAGARRDDLKPRNLKGSARSWRKEDREALRLTTNVVGPGSATRDDTTDALSPASSHVPQLRRWTPAALRRLAAAVIRRGDSPNTRRAYAGDLRHFLDWLADQELSPAGVDADDLDRYRASLIEPGAEGQPAYAIATANRRLIAIRSLYREAHRRGYLGNDPALWLRGIRGRDEDGGRALTMAQTRELMQLLESELGHPSRGLIALRDRALIGLLIRNGLRRSEVAALRVEQLTTRAGYPVIVLTGKGRTKRVAKLRPEMERDLLAWLRAAGVVNKPDAPMFCAVPKGGQTRRLTKAALSDRAVHAVVSRRLRQIGMPGWGAHALRGTFVTLALEAGAKLQLVQRAAGHADPRTTERYWTRRENLDDNAADYVRI